MEKLNYSLYSPAKLNNKLHLPEKSDSSNKQINVASTQATDFIFCPDPIKNHTTEEIPISVDKPQKCKLILNKEERDIEIRIIGRKIRKDSINRILSGDYLNDEVMNAFCNIMSISFYNKQYDILFF